MKLDLNKAEPQRARDLIPAGTICTVQMVIRPGGAGDDGLLTRYSEGACEGLDLEFTIVDGGDYAKRKIWQNLILVGNTDGHSKAGEISRTMLRGIWESAHGIKPDDMSEEAQSKRNSDLADFQNLRFVARISIEKSKDPAYDDKNRVYAVTPDNARQWHAVEQIPAVAQGTLPGLAIPAAAKSTQPIDRPAWAGK